MTAKEFAEKYAGYKVMSSCTVTSFGRLVGYTHDNFVCVELVNYENPWSRSRSTWNDAIFVVDVNTVKAFTRFVARELQPLSPPPPSISKSDYPHTCRDCKSPALMFGLFVDCSNVNCRNKYRSKSALDLTGGIRS